jgi:transposase-like protein
MDTQKLWQGLSAMPRTRPTYAPEFRRQMVEPVSSSSTPEELSREFEPSPQAVSNWVRQECGILAKEASWFARDSKATPSGSTG